MTTDEEEELKQVWHESFEDKAEAVALYPSVQKALDKLAKRGIIHTNKAANLKSKLAKHIQKLA